MFKILIVDDELLVRTNIKLLLRNLSDDFVVCGEAVDGTSGLEQIPLLQPDIIFSDMKMPNMDGVEFCQKVHERFPEIIIIALSNYDDYTYVRGALKNGAVDYVLKHKLNEEYLRELLNDIVQNIQIQTDTRLFSSSTIAALREKFILNLLGHMFLSQKDIEMNIKMLEIRLELTNVVPIILSVDDYSKMEYNRKIDQLNILNFSICNIGNEILNQYPTGILCHIERGTYCILVSFAYMPSQAKINETIHSLLHQLSLSYKDYLNISTSFCVGELTGSILTISDTYTKALDAMKLKFYSGKESIFHSENMTTSKKALSGLDYSMEKELISLIANSNYNKIQSILNELFADMIQQKENMSNVQMICTDLLSIITRVSKKHKLDLTVIINHKIPPDQIFTQLNTLYEIRDWFLDCFRIICEQIALQLPGNSSYVKAAIAFINRDFSKPISQQSVADAIEISVSYLSTIFKAETGQGFAEYLNSVRISNAIQMLEQGETNLHKVSQECGFQDYAYFFKVFKKRTGTTPKTYMKKI